MTAPVSAIRTLWKPRTTLPTLFSPTQVGVAAFIGGPFAAIYVLRNNLLALGMAAAARRVLVLGILACIALLLIVPVLPDKFPNIVIPSAYTGIALGIARSYAPKNESGDRDYVRESNWRVALIAVVSLVATVLAIFICLFAVISIVEQISPSSLSGDPVREG